jgi:hypothetical protein
MELGQRHRVRCSSLTSQLIRSCVSARARTTEAMGFIRKMTLNRPGNAWRDVLQSFEAARDEWSAMEAVVHLELLLEAEGLLIEERTAQTSPIGQDRFRAA